MSAQLFTAPLKLTAADVKRALRRRHNCDRGGDLSGMPGAWVCVEEALSGWASSGGGIDLLALGVWRSAKAPGLLRAGRHPWTNPIVAYEVKVSRADYRRELYGYEPGPKARNRRRVLPWPAKAWVALRRSNYFLFAIPAGLLTEEEIERRSATDDGGLWLPPEAGLIEVHDRGCRVRVEAEPRECKPLSTHEMAELLRYAIRNPERAAA